MAEGARLESVCTLTGTEGSNPSLSANYKNRFFVTGFFMSVPIGDMFEFRCDHNLRWRRE